jgi:hypothetical protein
MSEAKKIAVGVLGGIAAIVALFALVLMLASKEDEPAPSLQPLVAQVNPKGRERGTYMILEGCCKGEVGEWR